MAGQILDWMNMVTTVLEGILLLRIVMLKLQRVYTFITLYWLVNLIFDSCSWFFGWRSPESMNLVAYGSFLYALLLPFAAWDAYDELKGVPTEIRARYASMTLSSLLMTFLICALSSAYFTITADAEPHQGMILMGFYLWLGSSMTSWLYLWIFRRLTRTLGVPVSSNASTWTWLFTVALASQFLGVFAAPKDDTAGTWTLVGFSAITAIAFIWTLFRLRSAETALPTTTTAAS